MTLLIAGLLVLCFWLVVCYSLCKMGSKCSRIEEEEARKRAESGADITKGEK